MTTKLLNNHKKVVLFDIDYTFFDTATFKQSNLTTYQVYNEVPKTLSLLQSKAILGIFSEGDQLLQFKKLKETNVGKYFTKEHIFVVEKKDDVVMSVLKRYKDYKEVFFVDDKLSVLHKAKQLMPSLFCIWIRRGEYAMNQKAIEGFVPDAQITTLDEMVNIVQRE